MNTFRRRLDAVRKRRQTARQLAVLPPLLAHDLEVLAGALRAGSSFIQAVQVASQEGEPPLANEWKLFLREVQMGASLPQALQHLASRIPSPAIQSFVSAVTIVQETGGNLAGVFQTLSNNLRAEIVFQGKLRAMTAQGRLSGCVISAMPFLLIVILNALAPDLMRPLFTTPLGWMMLTVVMVFVAVGGLMIRKIVTIEV